jgi:hypothetical protein
MFSILMAIVAHLAINDCLLGQKRSRLQFSQYSSVVADIGLIEMFKKSYAVIKKSILCVGVVLNEPLKRGWLINGPQHHLIECRCYVRVHSIKSYKADVLIVLVLVKVLSSAASISSR